MNHQHHPTWCKCPFPENVHPAAFEAWVHVPSGSHLVKLWTASEKIAGAGTWRITLMHSHRDWKRHFWRARCGEVFEAAEREIEAITKILGGSA